MGEKTKLVFEFRQFLCLQKISKNRVIVDKKGQVLHLSFSYISKFYFSCSLISSFALFDQILNNESIGKITPPTIFPNTQINKYPTAFQE